MNTVLPATPDALGVDSDDDTPKPKADGLQRAFVNGERLAWKGIWFVVCGVSRDRIMLAPVEETAAHAKKRQGRGA